MLICSSVPFRGFVQRAHGIRWHWQSGINHQSAQAANKLFGLLPQLLDGKQSVPTIHSSREKRIAMNPFTMQPETRVPVGRVSAGDGSSTAHEKVTASPFRVGQRLALNSSFAVVDHHNFHDDSSKDFDLRKEGFSPLVKTKSESIPILNRMKRTPSELQLREDEELADYRDYVMFSRIVDRMSRSQREMVSRHLRHENDQCLAHVIGVRNGCADDVVRRELTQKHRLSALQQRLQPPTTAVEPSVPSNEQHARVVSVAEMDTMLAVDAADAAKSADDDEEKEDEQDVMFDLEL